MKKLLFTIFALIIFCSQSFADFRLKVDVQNRKITAYSNVLMYGPDATEDFAKKCNTFMQSLNNNQVVTDANGKTWTVSIQLEYKALQGEELDNWKTLQTAIIDTLGEANTRQLQLFYFQIPRKISRNSSLWRQYEFGFQAGDAMMYVDTKQKEYFSKGRLGDICGKVFDWTGIITCLMPVVAVHESFHAIGFGERYLTPKPSDGSVFEANLTKYLEDFHFDILSDNESSVNRIISKHHFNTIFNYTLSNGMLDTSSEKTVLDANLDNYWKP